MNINQHNYPEYLIDYLHNELSKEECDRLESWLNNHPDAKEEYLLLQQTILAPNEEIVFEHKELLLKPVEKKAWVINKNLYWAVAASVIGIVAALFWYGRQENPETYVQQPSVQPKTIQPKIIDPVDTSLPQTAQIMPVPSTKNVITNPTLQPAKNISTPVQNIVKKPSVIKDEKSTPAPLPSYQPQYVNQQTPKPLPTPVPLPEVNDSLRELVKVQIPNVIQDTLREDETRVANRNANPRALEWNANKSPKLFASLNKMIRWSKKAKALPQSLAQTEVTVVVGNKVLFNINH